MAQGKEHTPSDEIANAILKLAEKAGFNQKTLGEIFALDPVTLRKHYGEELAKAREIVTTEAMKTTLELIKEKEWAPTRFWLQCIEGFILKTEQNHTFNNHEDDLDDLEDDPEFDKLEE